MTDSWFMDSPPNSPPLMTRKKQRFDIMQQQPPRYSFSSTDNITTRSDPSIIDVDTQIQTDTIGPRPKINPNEETLIDRVDNIDKEREYRYDLILNDEKYKFWRLVMGYNVSEQRIFDPLIPLLPPEEVRQLAHHDEYSQNPTTPPPSVSKGEYGVAIQSAQILAGGIASGYASTANARTRYDARNESFAVARYKRLAGLEHKVLTAEALTALNTFYSLLKGVTGIDISSFNESVKPIYEAELLVKNIIARQIAMLMNKHTNIDINKLRVEMRGYSISGTELTVILQYSDNMKISRTNTRTAMLRNLAFNL